MNKMSNSYNKSRTTWKIVQNISGNQEKKECIMSSSNRHEL